MPKHFQNGFKKIWNSKFLAHFYVQLARSVQIACYLRVCIMADILLLFSIFEIEEKSVNLKKKNFKMKGGNYWSSYELKNAQARKFMLFVNILKSLACFERSNEPISG